MHTAFIIDMRYERKAGKITMRLYRYLTDKTKQHNIKQIITSCYGKDFLTSATHTNTKKGSTLSLNTTQAQNTQLCNANLFL